MKRIEAFRIAPRKAEKIGRLKSELRLSIIHITHDLATAYYVCNDIIIMRKGEIVERGQVQRYARSKLSVSAGCSHGATWRIQTAEALIAAG